MMNRDCESPFILQLHVITAMDAIDIFIIYIHISILFSLFAVSYIYIEILHGNSKLVKHFIGAECIVCKTIPEVTYYMNS